VVVLHVLLEETVVRRQPPFGLDDTGAVAALAHFGRDRGRRLFFFFYRRRHYNLLAWWVFNLRVRRYFFLHVVDYDAALRLFQVAVVDTVDDGLVGAVNETTLADFGGGT